MKLKDACSLKKSYDKSRQSIRKQRHDFDNKRPSSQSYGFPSSHLLMWELDHKESWAPNNWCFGFFLQHQNMYIIKGETDHQPRLDA